MGASGSQKRRLDQTVPRATGGSRPAGREHASAILGHPVGGTLPWHPRDADPRGEGGCWLLALVPLPRSSWTQ